MHEVYRVIIDRPRDQALTGIKSSRRQALTGIKSLPPDQALTGFKSSRRQALTGNKSSRTGLLQRFVVYLKKISDLLFPVSRDKPRMVRVLIIGFICTGRFKFH